MQNYSLRPDEDLNEDPFDDDPDHSNHYLNNSSSDVKLRRNNVESTTYPILHRALSTVSANQTLANNQRNVLAKNYRRTSINDEIVTIDHNDADASFILPNLYELPEDIRIRVTDSLVDTPTMASLEETKRLNWWVNKKLPCPKLYPLLTSGDGNCLLHATSLAMWGFHDHSLSMRKALNETLITSKPNNALYRRWRWTQSVQNKKYGLVFSEQEWNEEWKSLLRLSSAEPRISQTKPSSSSELIPPSDEGNPSKSSATLTSTNTGGSTKLSCQSTRQYYESLEEFHVYVLANNIRRPIVVYSDTVLRTNDGEAISPIEFGGIYLPLEIPPDKCHKQPVFLAFDAAHFSALVPMEQNSKPLSKVTYRIPLIDIETLDLLPIHFLVDPGLDFEWPIDEELSDERIQLYTNSGESRLGILERYLSLSKESSPFSTFVPSSTTHDDGAAATDSVSPPPVNVDPLTEATPIITTATTATATATTTPVTHKKLSRPSFNSFSKIIRRTFIHPFSSSKRLSFKHQHQQAQQAQQQPQSPIDTVDSSNLIESTTERRKSSPLLNRRTNILTIIVTNFQPKRPKTTDNMIKNYIDACLNDYRLEKMKKQLNGGTTTHENDHTQNYRPLAALNGNHTSKSLNDHSDWTDNSSSYQQPAASHRYHPSSVSNQYGPELLSTNLIAGSNDRGIETVTPKRQLPALPINQLPNRTAPPTQHVSRNLDIDDNEEFPPVENGSFSANITYVQPAQRRLYPLIQSNSLEITSDHYSHVNGNGANFSSTAARSSQKLIPSSLKRQQSTSSDQNANNALQSEARLTDIIMHPYISASTNINKRTQQMHPVTNGTSHQHHLDAIKRL